MRLVLGFLCLLLSPVTAFAEEEGAKIRTAGWVIAPYLEQGKFHHCYGRHDAEPTRPGGNNALGINAQGVFYASFYTPTWKLPEGQHYPLKLAAGAISIPATAYVWNPHQIGFQLAASTDFLAALRKSNAIEVTAGNFSFRADYSGAGQAIDALVACWRQNSPAEAANPFATKQADAANPFAARPADPANAPAAAPAPVASKAAGLRTKPTIDQVRAIFAPGFPDSMPNVTDLSKYADPPGSLVMSGNPTKQQFDGIIEFTEEARSGKSERAVLETATTVTAAKSLCIIHLAAAGKSGEEVVTAGAGETIGGVLFRRMTLGCPGKSWSQVLFAIGADRYQTFALSGEEADRPEIERRSKLVFDAFVATYR